MASSINMRLQRSAELVMFEKRLVSPSLGGAIALGLNEHAGETKRQSVTRISTFTGIPASRISSKTSVTPAAPGPFLSAKVELRDKAIGLTEYGAASWNRAMAGVEATAWNRRRIHKGTFLRGGVAYVRTTHSRYPIRKIYSTVLANEMANEGWYNYLGAAAYMQSDLTRRVTRHVMLALGL